MYEIPTYIEINKQSYPIRNKGDYRMVLDCFVTLNDETLPKNERIYAALIIFYEGMESLSDLNQFEDINEAVKQMFIFFNCGNNPEDNSSNMLKLINWEQDSQIICAAVNKVAGQEIRIVEYMHWWTFMGYYLSIGQSVLSQVVNLRYKLAKGTKLEKWERQFQQDNPQYFKVDLRTVQQREDDSFIQDLRDTWNED